MQPSQRSRVKLLARNSWFEKSLPRIRDFDLPENSKEHLDKRLNEGLEETFPSSGPVSVIHYALDSIGLNLILEADARRQR